MSTVDFVTTESSTECCSCSAEGSDANDGCSLWKIFRLCRRKHRAGSQTSLIKSGLASTSSSVAASKRTLTSNDGVLIVSTEPPLSVDLPPDSRSPPSYLSISRCVGGYSTFTTYAQDRQLPSVTVPPSSASNGPATCDVATRGTAVATVPKGGQQCRVMLVDDVIADVRTLTNGDSSVLVNGDDAGHCGSEVADDGRVSAGPTASTNSRDGAYFLMLVDNEQKRLQQLCCRTERHLEELNGTIPEEVQGKMRAAIGKANLLTTKKFRQFRQLCDENLSKKSEDPFQTTDADLAGFWDMVLLQVADVDSMFNELNDLRQHGWNVRSATVDAEPKNNVDASSESPSGSKGRTTPRSAGTAQTLPTSKSVKAEQSSRSRQEARQRLAAAKLAGRQRKASDSKKDVVEIFIS